MGCREARPALLLAYAGACSDGPDFDAIVDDHRDRVAGELRDCGELERDQSCAESLGAVEQCFADAFAACDPAEMRLVDFTVEGDALTSVRFVEPASDGRCEIVELTDHSADEFKGDYGDVVPMTCTSAVGLAFDPGTGTCARLSLDDCAIVREW